METPTSRRLISGNGTRRLFWIQINRQVRVRIKAGTKGVKVIKAMKGTILVVARCVAYIRQHCG